MKAGRVQAKDLAADDLLAAVEALTAEGYSARTWDLEEAFPAIPRKVILAKCRSLIRQGLLDGCPCGCPGHFILPHAPPWERRA